jgi:large subunit ribosomal protein L4
MPTVKIYDKKGKESGELKLPDAMYGNAETRSRDVEGETVDVQRNLVANLHQAVLAEQANERQGTHSTRTRGMVRGGGRKPFKQKKLGRARQGTIRAPHWKGGGVVFGPSPRSHEQKMNRRSRRLAIQSALGYKIASDMVVAIDGVNFERFKTKDALEFLKQYGGDGPRTLVILGEHNPFAVRSFRNLPDVELRTAPDFSARDIMVARRIIMDKSAFQIVEELWSK